MHARATVEDSYSYHVLIHYTYLHSKFQFVIWIDRQRHSSLKNRQIIAHVHARDFVIFFDTYTSDIYL